MAPLSGAFFLEGIQLSPILITAGINSGEPQNQARSWLPTQVPKPPLWTAFGSQDFGGLSHSTSRLMLAAVRDLSVSGCPPQRPFWWAQTSAGLRFPERSKL